MRLVLPRLYVILDAALISIPEKDCARNLVDAGVRLIQYRNKKASARQLFETSRELAEFLNPARSAVHRERPRGRCGACRR